MFACFAFIFGLFALPFYLLAEIRGSYDFSHGFSGFLIVEEYRAAIAGIKLLTSGALFKPCPHRLHSQLNSRNCNAITDYPKHFHSWPLNPTLALWNGNGNGNTHSHTRNLVSLISMHYMLANLDGLWFWPIARVLHIWFWLYILAMFSWLYDLGVYFRYFEHFQFMRLSLK